MRRGRRLPGSALLRDGERFRAPSLARRCAGQHRVVPEQDFAHRAVSLGRVGNGFFRFIITVGGPLVTSAARLFAIAHPKGAEKYSALHLAMQQDVFDCTVAGGRWQEEIGPASERPLLFVGWVREKI